MCVLTVCVVQNLCLIVTAPAKKVKGILKGFNHGKSHTTVFYINKVMREEVELFEWPSYVSFVETWKILGKFILLYFAVFLVDRFSNHISLFGKLLSTKQRSSNTSKKIFEQSDCKLIVNWLLNCLNFRGGERFSERALNFHQISDFRFPDLCCCHIRIGTLHL